MGCSMNVYCVLAVALCLLMQLSGCDSKSSKSTKTSFNTSSTKLYSIPPDYQVGDAVFSSDGRHFAVVLKKDGKVAMNIDMVTGLFYDEVKDASFHIDSGKYAYIARKGTKVCVIDNGKVGKLYDIINIIQFTADGTVVYAAKSSDKWVIVVGSNESQPFESVSDVRVFLSPDGKRLAYAALDSMNKKVHLIVSSLDFKDKVTGKEYDSISSMRSNSSKSHLVYSAGINRKKSLVVFDFKAPGCSEKATNVYDDVLLYSIANDGAHLSYLAARGGQNVLITDDHESIIPRLDMTLNFFISQQGNTIFSSVQKDKVVTFYNGQAGVNTFTFVDFMSFSTDGLHYVFVGERASKSRIVVDGKLGPEYDKIVNPRFSPDGTRVVYRARNSGQRFAVTADLQAQTIKEHPQYEAVWDVFFSPDSKNVGYGVKIGQELWWKVEKL